MIEVKDLTVKYGGVTSLDGMSITFEAGTCGLIGPNGAGKTTFFNVLSGFVRPVSGSVRGFGDDLLKLTHYRRARWGVRRTFQTEQAIEGLTVYDNVAMQSLAAARRARRADVLAAIEFAGGGLSPDARVGSLGAGQRRLVEVARTLAGKPRLVLLDEPAAGLPEAETTHLTSVIKSIPDEDAGADHPRRPRHVAGLRGVRDHGRARLRQADRVRPDHGGAARRERDARLSRNSGGRDMSSLILSGLTVERGGRPVVKDVTITVPAGEVTAVLGPNGAGKSSMVLAVGGVLKPRPGSVSMDGVELAGRRPEKIRAAGVAIVPEGRRLLPDLSVEDNIRVATYALSKQAAVEGRARALELFPALEQRLTVPARSLSGGEQQMVVLAQALVSQPKYILIDELSLGLAPVVVNRLIPVIRAVVASGIGVLLIEQFATVALGLATSAYVMEGGVIRYSGTASELRDNPELLHSAYLLRGSTAAPEPGQAGAPSVPPAAPPPAAG